MKRSAAAGVPRDRTIDGDRAGQSGADSDGLLAPRVVAGVLGVMLAAIYLPDVGHGFVKDDFVWIVRSQVHAWRDLRLFLDAPTGFFRPVVSLSFAANYAACGLSAWCYGLTNAALLFACGAGVFVLARAIGLSRGACVLAAAVWAFNWHGINMATVWISGRTALLLVLFSTFGAAAFAARRAGLAAVLVLLAMLCKEEAVLLPGVLLLWLALATVDGGNAVRKRVIGVCAAGIPLVAYFALRARSGAFTVEHVPPFYALAFTAERFGANAIQYADRSMTFAAVVFVLFLLIARPGGIGVRRIHAPLAFGAAWWIGGFAITMFLPVRSSLYACLPSIGTALIVAALCHAAWDRVAVGRRRAVIVAGIALPVLLWPIYHARNRGSVREAELSAAALAKLNEIAASHGAGTSVLLRDDRSRRPSLDDAFGTLLQDAADLAVRPRIRVWMSPAPRDAGLAGLNPPGHVDVVVTLESGRLKEF